MADERSPAPNSGLVSKINFDTPHSARIWNYWMGGKETTRRTVLPVMPSPRCTRTSLPWPCSPGSS